MIYTSTVPPTLLANPRLHARVYGELNMLASLLRHITSIPDGKNPAKCTMFIVLSGSLGGDRV